MRSHEKSRGVPKAHANPHMPFFQTHLFYPLLSCLPSMHKTSTPRLEGGRGGLTKLKCCFEHYYGLSLYFITDSYLLLVSFYVGFLYILVQKLIFSILTHNPKSSEENVWNLVQKGQNGSIYIPFKNLGTGR